MKYFLDKNISLRRLRSIDSNRSAFSATGTASYKASIQEMSADRVQLYEGQIGDMFDCFVDITCPAREGDQVVHSGTTYSVKDTKIMDFGINQFKRLVLVV